MHRSSASILAIALAAAIGTASAQSYSPNNRGFNYQPSVDRYGQSYGAQYDYARVVRVDPVLDSRTGYGNTATSNQRCYTRQDGYYAGGDPYHSGTYRNDPYARGDVYGNTRGSDTGSTVATVVGGVLGAVVGSQLGGGTGRYATSALGSMVGGIAGRQVYEANQRNRYPQQGSVTVCDPVPVGSGGYYPTASSGYGGNTGYGGGVRAYDVTYEYAGRRYTTRTDYHPGDTIRVRVDVRPE